MSTRQAPIQVRHGKMFILSTRLPNSVRFLGDWLTLGDESVHDDGWDDDKGQMKATASAAKNLEVHNQFPQIVPESRVGWASD